MHSVDLTNEPTKFDLAAREFDLQYSPRRRVTFRNREEQLAIEFKRPSSTSMCFGALSGHTK